MAPPQPPRRRAVVCARQLRGAPPQPPRRRAVAYVAVVALSSCLLPVYPALARGPAVDEETRQAKAHFKAGEAHFSLGAFGAALDEYRKAYLLRPLPPLLFNMAQCHRHLGDLEKAEFLLRRFLATGPTAVQRSQAEAVLREVELAAKKRSTKTGAGTKPTTRPLPAASAPSARPVVTPLAPRVAAPPASLPLRAPGTPPDPTPRTPLYKRWWLWTIVGGAAVVTATAIGVAASRGDDLPKGTLPTVDYR